MQGNGDYISREAAINAGWNALYKYEDETEKRFMDDPELNIDDWFLLRIFVQGMHNEYLEAVMHLPAAAVRPVVLCKDCIHCKKGKASLECEKHTYAWNNMRRWVDEDDFCKWGVKREES